MINGLCRSQESPGGWIDSAELGAHEDSPEVKPSPSPMDRDWQG